MADFKTRLRELRLKNSYSGTELGALVGVTRYAVSKWETGESTAPQDILAKLASIFNVSTDYLLGRTDDPRPFPVEDTRSIEEKLQDDPIAFKVYEGLRDMSDEQKKDLIRYMNFLKS